MPKINYCLVVLNRLSELQQAIRRVSPWVDRTIVIDGASEDGSLDWLSSQECKDLNVIYKVSKQYRYAYGNHTPKERNQYLELAGTEGWILTTDSDEFLEEKACQTLRDQITSAESSGKDGIMYRAHDYWTYEDGQVYNNISNYWNPMLFKACPGMHYSGHTHSHVVRPGAKNQWIQSPYEYLHVKSERRMWHSSTYLWWTTAAVASNTTSSPVWKDFHKIMEKYGYTDWHEFNKIMNRGNIEQEIKDWFIAHKDADNPEERSWFVHYFIFMHPDENILQVSNRDKVYNYIIECQSKYQ